MRTNFDKNNARLHFQGAEMLNEHNERISTEKENAISERQKSIMEAAYTNIGADIHNKRVRQQNAERMATYQEHFAVVALTEALTQVADEALLLNKEEYAKLNENYKSEMRETIRNFLENADINEDITNPDILALYEEIVKETPPADLYLSEEDEVMIVRQNILSNAAIDKCLDTLQRNVKVRTANIVAKDQENLGNIENDIDYIDNKELEAAPLVMPEVPEEETMEEPLADPDAEVSQETPAVAGPEPIDAPVQTESVKPFIAKETPKQGIVETLAMNEANKMLSEGKEYDSTLALANALKLITVLETLDASSLVAIGTPGYNKILSASGVDLSPKKGLGLPGSDITDTPVVSVKKVEVSAEAPKIELPETPKEEALRNKISEIVKSSTPSNLMNQTFEEPVFTPYNEWKRQHSSSEIKVFDTPARAIQPIEENLSGKWTNMKGEVFTESQLMDYFENQGFNLNLTDFEELARSWNFRKHN